MKLRFATLLLAIGALFAMPASAQLAVIQKGPITASVSGPASGGPTCNNSIALMGVGCR